MTRAQARGANMLNGWPAWGRWSGRAAAGARWGGDASVRPHGPEGFPRPHGHLCPASRYGAVAAALVLMVLPVATAPAGASARVGVTRVVARMSPATVHDGSVLVVSGSVSPRASGPVALQRLVGKTWRVVGKAKVTTGGSFTCSVRAPGKATGWVLRVTRAASATMKAGVSGLLHVRVVTAMYAVTVAALTPVMAVPRGC